MRCALAHCPGAKSTRFSTIQDVSSHTFTQFRQDFNVILLIYRLAAGYTLCHHNNLDIKENSCAWTVWEIIMFTLSLPSENRLCHSNTRARDMQSSP